MARTSKRIYLNQDEIITLNDFMRTVCATTKEDGRKIAAYTAPWTDSAVAKELKAAIPHILESHVMGFRQRVFGELKRGGSLNNTAALTARVEALEATIKTLVAWAKDVEPNWPNYKP